MPGVMKEAAASSERASGTLAKVERCNRGYVRMQPTEPPHTRLPSLIDFRSQEEPTRVATPAQS